MNSQDTLNLSDFTKEVDEYGYMIYYKGRPIGGAGSLRKGKRSHWRHRQADISMYRQQADVAIRDLVDGVGQERYLQTIRLIDLEGTTTVPVSNRRP